MKNKFQLLCTFAKEKKLLSTLSDILKKYEILHDRIFVYETRERDKREREILYTYNIKGAKSPEFLDNTISIHRKKESNTFYTINALNLLIKEINNGVLDTSLEIDWDNYQDTILLIRDNKLKKIKLNDLEIYYI